MEVPLPLEADHMKLLPGPLRRRRQDRDEPLPKVGDGKRWVGGRPPEEAEQAVEREKEADRERTRSTMLEVPITVLGYVDARSGAGPLFPGFLFRKVPKGTNW